MRSRHPFLYAFFAAACGLLNLELAYADSFPSRPVTMVVPVSAGSGMFEWNAGDLLFFSDRADRRITHVGISLGGARMVHLGLGRGGYAVEQLDSRDDQYVTSLMSRFVAARRVI